MAKPSQIPDTRLYVGDQDSCLNWVGPIIHACKDPCWRRVVGPEKIEAGDPRYLHVEDGRHLFLNLIDPPVPLFKIESFRLALDFIDAHLNDAEPLLIHCNQGASRSPSIAMLWMAKRRAIDTFDSANTIFNRIYDHYSPGRGIVVFLSQHWSDLVHV